MILERPSLEALRSFAADVCVIGSGPVGTATALALTGHGLRVLMLESGGPEPEPAIRELSEAENLRPDNNFDPHTAVGRQLGGTSNLWGGRCLPFDPIDFQERPWLGLSAWALTADDLAPYLERAVGGLGAGAPAFTSPLPDVQADGGFRFDTLERWSNVPRTQRLHHAALRSQPGLLVALRTTVTGFVHAADGRRVAALNLHIEGESAGELPVERVVLAAGGNESTRLLLTHQRKHPALFGGTDGPLGRFYMGHLGGNIADVVFESAALHDGLDFHVDAHGSYVRRRIVPDASLQAEEGLANIAFWPVVPRIADPAHRSGPLSAVFLALSVDPVARRLLPELIRSKHVGARPYRRGVHARNILGDLPRTLGFAPAFLWKNRVARMRLPGFFLRNPARRYGLEYHAEQMPNPDSRLTLGAEADRLGLPRLRIDLRFADADADSVLRAHVALADWFARNRLARLEYHQPAEDRRDAVLAAAKDGAHQIGTIRMGLDRRSSVVDAECRTFDLANLFVASTGVLPSSGQANPTLTAVQLGLRLADRLAAERP